MAATLDQYRSLRLKLAALGLVAVLGLLGALTYLGFTGAVADAMNPPVDVTVSSPRAGLIMVPGSLVKMHGVEVGTVTAVRPTETGAAVDIRIDGDAAATVPADVGAEIAATTIFGSKFVTLTEPAEPAGVGRPIESGAVIDSSSVTAEANSIFESLTAVLDVVQPEKLNATLTALATALRGNGSALGAAIDDANSVLARLEPSIPALQRDIVAGADTAEALADAAPGLMATLGNLSVTADTVTATQNELDPLLLGVIGMSDVGARVLGTNSDAITDTITTLRPTSDLLGDYSPVLTCFLQGSDRARILAEKVSGANGKSMLLNSTVLFGVDPYTYANDLPVVGATGGPRCGALPDVSLADVPTPFVLANTGSNPFRRANTSPEFAPGSILDFLPDGLLPPGGRP